MQLVNDGLDFWVVDLRGRVGARVRVEVVFRHGEERVAEVVGHGEVVVHFEHFHYEVGVSRAVDGFLRGVERVGGYRGQPVGRCERVGVLPRFAVVRQRDGYLCGTAGGVVALVGVEAALCPVYAELVGQPVGRVDAQVVVVVDRFKTVVARVENGAHVAVDKVGKACPLARRSVPDVSLGICVKLACVGGNRIVVVVNRHVGFKKF